MGGGGAIGIGGVVGEGRMRGGGGGFAHGSGGGERGARKIQFQDDSRARALKREGC